MYVHVWCILNLSKDFPSQTLNDSATFRAVVFASGLYKLSFKYWRVKEKDSVCVAYTCVCTYVL